MAKEYKTIREVAGPLMMVSDVENAAQHIARNGQLQGVTQKADFGITQVDAGRRFKQLNHSLVAVYSYVVEDFVNCIYNPLFGALGSLCEFFKKAVAFFCS